MKSSSKPRLTSKTIHVRKSLFQASGIKRHYATSPLLSHLLTALSMTFPEGERFFVESVRNVRHLVDDPILQADISAFIGQESYHAQSHAAFNLEVLSADYNIDAFQEAMTAEFIRLRTLSHRRQLAATVALEHFTAMIAGYMLKHPHMMNRFDPNMQNLWMWHTIEELEHKSVAFDVYQQVFNNLAQRRRSMRTISFGFLVSNATVTAHLLWQDRKNSLGNVKNLLKNTRDLGQILYMMLSIFPEYLAFYSQSFHPKQIDHTQLLAKWLPRLEQKQSRYKFS
ncbi:MAG: metal-dependent hydrolase [Candidatus Saccharibacteria bacterium]|nr:metal-dependent hydrolase [Moraxellaceae bacterium]